MKKNQEHIQESDRIRCAHGNHIISDEQSVTVIISYLVVWPHVCDTAVVNIYTHHTKDTRSPIGHILNCRRQY
jgi:hypothetical protein